MPPRGKLVPAPLPAVSGTSTPTADVAMEEVSDTGGSAGGL